MKVVYLVDTLTGVSAGTELQFHETLIRLNRKRFEPVVLALHDSPWLRDNTLPCPLHVLGYHGMLKPDIFAVIRRLRRFVREQEADIVQTFFEDASILGAFAGEKKGRLPVLLTSRRDIGLGADTPWYHVFYRVVRPKLNRRFAAVVANGWNVRDHVIRSERVPPGKVRVVPNGVSIPSSAVPKPAIMRTAGNVIWAVVAANIKPIKRLDLFVEALARLRDLADGRILHGLILGNGGTRPELERLAERLGVANRLYMPGSVSNVSDYLVHADIGVLCSDLEGLPNAVLEYMAAGLAVVATAVGDIPSLVVDGRTGILVPPGDAKALAEGVHRLADDEQLRRSMAAEGRTEVERRFTWEASLKALEGLYEEIVATRFRSAGASA